VKELPPVNYFIQKTKRSRPFITHVDKLKHLNTDNPPRSWLRDEDSQPSTANNDHERIADRNAVLSPVDISNVAERSVNAGLHTDNARHFDDMVNVADSGMVNNRVDGGSRDSDKDERHPCSVIKDTCSGRQFNDGQSIESQRAHSAIAGDPESRSRPMDRPRQTPRRLERFKDFTL